MKRRLVLVVLIVVLGVFLIPVLGVSRGWIRERIAVFEFDGRNNLEIGMIDARCVFDIYLSQRRIFPREKRVKIYLSVWNKGLLREDRALKFETSMDLEDWEAFTDHINWIDQRLHQVWSELIIRGAEKMIIAVRCPQCGSSKLCRSG